MFAFYAGLEREVWRAAGDEIESFAGMQHAGFTEIAFANVVAIRQAVVARRLPREGYTFRLRFDGDESRARHTPRANHPNRADASAKVERRPSRGTPGRSIPCRKDIVGRKAVPIAELKQAEVSADRVECFGGIDSGFIDCSGWNGAGLGPFSKMRGVFHGSITTCDIIERSIAG